MTARRWRGRKISRTPATACDQAVFVTLGTIPFATLETVPFVTLQERIASRQGVLRRQTVAEESSPMSRHAPRLLQPGQDGLDPAVGAGVGRQIEFGENGRDVFLDGSLAND